LPGRVLASGETVWISDLPADGNFPRLEFAARCDLHSAFAFPIRLGEKVLGVIEFFSRQERERDPELLDIFAAIGAQLGQFIERQRAEEDIRLLNVDLERRIEKRTSELADANLRLVDALERERELSRLKSSFVALVSHEFRTPLGIILSASEILGRYLDKLDAAERAEQLAGIDEAVRRMSALMEQVLTFSHVESGRIEYHPEPFNLSEFCTELRDEVLSATARRCPIELTIMTPLEDAVGDQRLLRHVLTNLITNAVKYSAAGRSVRVNVRREGPSAIITVADHGVGIPAADLQRLFQPFQRGCNVSDLPGTGLGLVIVKKCLDAHGGSLELDSVEGVGTTARITLPLFPERDS
jgi:signal transduction histidine kinase